MAPEVRVEESPGSRRGQVYMSASGERIPNLGQQNIDFITDEGRPLRGQYQVAEVNRALLSVGKICDNNKRVIFGKNGGAILCLKTGRTTSFLRQNGVYLLNMWVKKGDSSFMRQGW